MNSVTGIAAMTATQMLNGFASGELSPVEATEAALAPFHRLDQHVNAWCFLDQETTGEQARRAEERWRRGMPLGLPVGLRLAGPRHRDDRVLRAAYTYQSARPLTDRRPALFANATGPVHH